MTTHALTAAISDELLLSFSVNVTLASVEGTGVGITSPKGLSLAEQAPKKETDAVIARTFANEKRYCNLISLMVNHTLFIPGELSLYRCKHVDSLSLAYGHKSVGYVGWHQIGITGH